MTTTDRAPDPGLDDVIEVLGRDETLARLDRAARIVDNG
jgi:hypothetical protein